MIVKARAGTGGPALARYLDGGKNEHAELLELRNMGAASLRQAVFQMDALARGSQCERHALHVQMRAAPGERLSADHWRDAADRYAEAFGLHEHQAALILHNQPDGATHCHIVFNRVHPDTLKAVHLSHNYAKHKELSRQMETDWGLRQVPDRKRDQPRDYSNAGRPETEQARRAGADVHDIRDSIRQAWERSDNAVSFGVALADAGFTLARGDRRDFVAVDDNGHVYSIGKRSTGASAAAVRERMEGLGPVDVPTLAEVRLGQELAREEEAKLERERKGRGEASAAHIPAFNSAAGRHYDQKPERFFANREARRADWERAAAARLERMEARHARQFEKQQGGFEQAANLERGEAVREFNHTQRHDLTAALLKQQARELATEQERQHQRRAKWSEQDRDAEARRALAALREQRDQNREKFRKGGFKQYLRDELTRQRHQPAHVGATNDNTPRPSRERDRNVTYENKPPVMDTGQPKAWERENQRAEFLAWLEEQKLIRPEARDYEQQKAKAGQDYDRQKSGIIQAEREKTTIQKALAAWEKRQHETSERSRAEERAEQLRQARGQRRTRTPRR